MNGWSNAVAKGVFASGQQAGAVAERQRSGSSTRACNKAPVVASLATREPLQSGMGIEIPWMVSMGDKSHKSQLRNSLSEKLKFFVEVTTRRVTEGVLSSFPTHQAL